MTHLLWSLTPLLERRDSPAALDPSPAELAADLKRMRSSPVTLSRPVVVLAGYRAWSLMPRAVAATLAELTSGRHWREDFLPIAYPLSTRLEAIAGRVGRATKERFGDAPVNVVAVSMGGLVARAAAAGLTAGGPALRISRLFTLATPHQGASLAEWLRPDAAARDMRPGSAFLERLEAARRGGTGGNYEMVCYARLRDRWVGASRTSPPGEPVVWVHGWRVLSHLTVSTDLRILSDIAHRLRGEAPWPIRSEPPPRD